MPSSTVLPGLAGSRSRASEASSLNADVMTGKVAYRSVSTPTVKGHSIGKFALIAIIFYEVSGGPFGSETTVGAAGPMLAILGFALLPLIWSVPEAFITAELSTMLPDDAGHVLWTTTAFGPYWGFIEGFLSWLSGVADNALYPLLMMEYIAQVVPFLDKNTNPTAHIIATLSVSLGLTILNYCGLNVVGGVTIFLCIFTLLPFLLMTILGLFQLQPSLWMDGFTWNINELIKNPEIKWSAYINNLFWNLNYWDSVSTLTGEVSNPAKDIPPAMMWSLILVVLAYLLPVGVGSAVCIPDPKNPSSCFSWRHWKQGTFALICEHVGGKFLKYWVILASCLANMGLFIAELSSDSYQILGMADMGMLPKFLGTRSRFGTPVLGIALSCAGITLSFMSSFEDVVEFLNLLYCLASLLEFGSFIWLRYKYPEWHRPYRVPLPLWACVLYLIPTVAFTLVMFFLASIIHVYVLAASIVVGTVLYYVCVFVKRKGWAEFEEDWMTRMKAVDGEETISASSDLEVCPDTASSSASW